MLDKRKVRVLTREEIFNRGKGYWDDNYRPRRFYVGRTYYNPDMGVYAGKVFTIIYKEEGRYVLDLPQKPGELRWAWSEGMLEPVFYGLGSTYE